MTTGKSSGQNGVSLRVVNNATSNITLCVTDLQIVEFDTDRDAMLYINNLSFTQV